MRALLLLWLWLCALPALAHPCEPAVVGVQAGQVATGQMPGAVSHWQPVTLPDNWDGRWPDYHGEVWYRIDWECKGNRTGPLALTLTSVVMAGEAYSNDDLIWQDDSLVEPLSRSWNMARTWVLPKSSLREGVNTVWVRVAGVPDLSPGLGVVHLGTPAAMQAIRDDLRWRNRTLYAVNLVVSLAMGLLFFCIWVVRRSQQDYGWYAFMAVFWALYVANIVVTTPWPFNDSVTMARANVMALVAYVLCFCMFTFRFGGQSWPRIEKALWWYCAALMAFAVFTPVTALQEMLIGVTVAAALVFFVNCLQFPWYAWRSRVLDHRVWGICLLVFFVAGLHDFLLVFKVLPGNITYTAFTSIIAMVAMSGLLGVRIARSISRMEQFNLELAESVQQARAELRTTLALEHSLELANTRLQDRLQLAHDLHDGPGGSLVRMMAMVEQAPTPLENQQVLSILKHIRDDLRHTIDSGSSAGVKVPATPRDWVAPLRHRFMLLFDELGIAVYWDVPQAWRSPPDAMQCLALTRLLEESLTNVVKHSRARKVQVSLAQDASSALSLRIEDDGVGFDVAAVKQAGISVGMRSMQARIARVGGHLDVASRAGLTVLTAVLPAPRF